MAVIGLRYPVWAPYASGGSGEAIVYGTPVTDAHAIEANISWSRNENNLYADDTIVEYDNSIMSGTISLMIDNLSATMKASMLGMTETSVGTGVYEDSDAAAPHGGFGYIKVIRSGGTTSYEAYWIHDVVFTLGDESAKTRGANIEWQTPAITGQINGVLLDETGVYKFRQMSPESDYEDAVSFIDTIAGVT